MCRSERHETYKDGSMIVVLSHDSHSDSDSGGLPLAKILSFGKGNPWITHKNYGSCNSECSGVRTCQTQRPEGYRRGRRVVPLTRRSGGRGWKRPGSWTRHKKGGSYGEEGEVEQRRVRSLGSGRQWFSLRHKGQNEWWCLWEQVWRTTWLNMWIFTNFII